MDDCRKEFEAWWDEFSHANEDWQYGDSHALRWAAWQAARNSRASPASAPEVLFDGYAVYQALSERAKSRTSSQNVADALDAVVRILRNSAATTPPVSEDWKDAERYRWLRNKVGVFNDGYFNVWMPTGCSKITDDDKIITDAAIDAAMQETKP